MKKVICCFIVTLMAFSPLGFVAHAGWGGSGGGGGGVFSPQNPYLDAKDNGSVEGVNVIGDSEGQEDAFVNVVRGGINRVLGILAFIALIILLYGGFLMVTAAGDEERYKKGFTILKQAAVGLILIGVAWFIVSIIFWLVNLTGRAAEGQGANTQG